MYIILLCEVTLRHNNKHYSHDFGIILATFVHRPNENDLIYQQEEDEKNKNGKIFIKSIFM